MCTQRRKVVAEVGPCSSKLEASYYLKGREFLACLAAGESLHSETLLTWVYSLFWKFSPFDLQTIVHTFIKLRKSDDPFSLE